MPFDPTDPDTKAAIAAAIEESTAGLKTKVEELIGDNKKLKADLRSTQEIKPEDLTKLEAENDKLKGDLAAAQKQVKDLAKTAETATKQLEAEQGAARGYALEAEITTAIAEGGVVPALAPAFKALISQGAKAELVDGKYVVTIGDKPARDHIKELLVSDEGKHFVAAAINGGGGAPGGKTGGEGSKTIDRAAWDGMDHLARASFAKEGGKVIDQAA